MVLKSQSGSLHLSIMVPTGRVVNIFSARLGSVDNSSSSTVLSPGSLTHHFRYFISFKVSLQAWSPHILYALNCSTMNLIGTPHCSLKSFKTIIVSLFRRLGKLSPGRIGTEDFYISPEDVDESWDDYLEDACKVENDNASIVITNSVTQSSSTVEMYD